MPVSHMQGLAFGSALCRWMESQLPIAMCARMRASQPGFGMEHLGVCLLLMSTHSGECNSNCEHSIVLLPTKPAGGCEGHVCVQCTTLLPRTL